MDDNARQWGKCTVMVVFQHDTNVYEGSMALPRLQKIIFEFSMSEIDLLAMNCDGGRGQAVSSVCEPASSDKH